mmetsp:Transcript_28888/g.52339  ORF Transcript_28888/g.52339 Transcript_28888/m.52339 type:complete len:204 (+) Transcript_28888:2468-3079(+)
MLTPMRFKPFSSSDRSTTPLSFWSSAANKLAASFTRLPNSFLLGAEMDLLTTKMICMSAFSRSASEVIPQLLPLLSERTDALEMGAWMDIRTLFAAFWACCHCSLIRIAPLRAASRSANCSAFLSWGKPMQFSSSVSMARIRFSKTTSFTWTPRRFKASPISSMSTAPSSSVSTAAKKDSASLTCLPYNFLPCFRILLTTPTV